MCAMLESAGSFPNEEETEAWLAKKAPEGDPEDEDLEDDLEDDDEDDVAVRVPRVVHALVRETAGQRPIAHDVRDLVVLALEIASGSDAERGRHRRSGMARAEVIVLALGTFQEPGDPVTLA